MSNLLSHAQRHQKHTERLDWLRAHPALLARLPGANDDVERDQSEAVDEALRGLKLVRLYAPTAAADAARWGIRLLVSELRGQAVSGQDPKYRR